VGKFRPIFDSLSEAAVRGARHADVRLPELTRRHRDQIDDWVRRIRDEDRFDDAPDAPAAPGARTPGGSDSDAGDAEPLPYSDPTSRPSFRSGVVQRVWDAAIGPDGLVRDPNTGDVIDWTSGDSRRGVWDMGHVPGQRYADQHARYMAGDLTPAEFRDWYNDPAHYRPELPGNNRSHLYE